MHSLLVGKESVEIRKANEVGGHSSLVVGLVSRALGCREQLPRGEALDTAN